MWFAAKPTASLLFLLLPLVMSCEQMEEPTVKVAQGEVRGVRIVRSANAPLHAFYAFKGIPYARPPHGEHRFKDPEEVGSWNGIRNATSYSSNCIQKSLDTQNVTGDEDCLYLNVFTAGPAESWNSSKRPVIVWFHGGAFVVGSGNMENRRPDPLLRHGIVFVSVNYRLGVMGFLNTEDSQAPGNAGLKDQTMALRWVQRNIAAFGGDPNKVTIMGESAGGASVHYHLLSPLSRGLFHGAISVSGSALPSWARVQRPREQALALRRRFAGACPQLPEEDIVSCLRKVDAQELVFNQYDVPLQPYQNFFLKNTFLPSVEDLSAGTSPFLTAEQEELLQNGTFSRVPYMTGFTSGEGLLIAFLGFLGAPSRWATMDEHFEAIFRWELPPGHRTPEGARQLRRFYLGDRSLRDAQTNTHTLAKFLQMIGDQFISSGSATAAHLMAEKNAAVYVYQFCRDGPIAFTKAAINASHIPGVMHGDDLAYIFDIARPGDIDPLPVPITEQPLREQWTQMVVNMAKTGNPTPEGSGSVQWPLYSNQKKNYLNVDVQLTVRENLLDERFALWRSLGSGILPSTEK